MEYGILGFADFALRAHQALRHGGGRHQERVRDLVSGQAAQRAQGERDLRFRGECGVAAGKHQAQSLVGHGVVFRIGRLQVALVERHEFGEQDL